MKMSFNGIEVEVTPVGDLRQWFMTVDDVAQGYGIAPATVVTHLYKHSDELREGIERGTCIANTLGGPQTITVLYREGVIKLGFFTRSQNAANFRQWATNLIIQHLDQTGTDLRDVLTGMRQDISTIQGDMAAIRGEFDELRELVNMAISDSDEKEIRGLIAKVKAHTKMDGRAIVGHVRKTLASSGIYNTPNLVLVKNVLRNMLGQGLTVLP